ncbi:MAG: hypothetical protein LJE62_13010 [Silicimonas sp.]|nr:hypothetical protein [Silicimonas sp.]
MSAIRHVVTVLLLSFLLAGCQEDTADASAATADIPEILTPFRTACEKDGGRWGKVRGSDRFTCYKTTRDANKPCDSGLDCDGLCLARSRTCAPVTPFFGCHEVLSKSGLRQTLCTQ